MKREYQICKRCIMDTSDPDITFDERGFCNHCRFYEEKLKAQLRYDEEGQKELESIIQKIKEEGKDKEYDCIIGMSGGADSSMTAYLVKKMGLRPLAIHLDNGWDTELAVSNIERLLRKLDIPLYTIVLDWEEFKDLQLSFLKASVANCEIPTDHAINAVLCKTALERRIRYIIKGGNIATESILPESWGYQARDLKHLLAIHKKFGKLQLKTFPTFSIWQLAWHLLRKNLVYFPILNYVNYNKKEAKEFLKKEFGWQDYGGKHYESIYTRFFQGYFLPQKFGFDKRRAHFSSLIMSSQMTREEALKEMEKPPYPDEKLLQEDRAYVIKKFGLGEKEWEEIMNTPRKSYKDYPNDEFFIKLFSLIYRFLKMFLVK